MLRLHFSRRAVVALIAALLVTGILGYELHRRQSLYWYDAGADYTYSFADGAVRRIQVALTDSGFTFPPAGDDWDTALLRLRVQARLSGAWFEPNVTVGSEENRCRQSLERRAEGTRYLNLCVTAGDVSADRTIRLSGRHVKWADQQAELLLFRNPDPDTLRMLVLAPHADDAEIAAFGLYAHRDSWVVTVTNGSYGGEMYRGLAGSTGQLDSLQAELRVWNSMVVPVLGGLAPDRATNLGYFTLALERMHHAPHEPVQHPVTGVTSVARWRRTSLDALRDRPTAASWENLVGDLVALLTALMPEAIVMPHPALDANRDHIFTAAALLEALQHAGDPAVDLLLYTNHHALTEYYPFGPAGDAVTLPPWLDGSVPFVSVYSHSLDEPTLVAKVFALDAMHDLRDAPRIIRHGPFGEFGRRLGRSARDLARDPAGELSYFRRAVRSNELFFRYTSADRALLQALVPTSADSGEPRR